MWTSSFFSFIIKVFIGILGEIFEIQFLAIFFKYYILIRDLNQIWKSIFLKLYYWGFHWNIRGNLLNPVFGNILYRI